MTSSTHGQPRRLIVVAVATTGPEPRRHHVAEIAAVDIAGNRRWHLAVPLTRAQLADADPDFLDASDYIARGVAAMADQQATQFRDELATLAAALTGNTLAGPFPEFTGAFLAPLLLEWGMPALWHDRLADIGALTAGAWGISATQIPALPLCCRLWRVQFSDLHTPCGQAAAAAGCFGALQRFGGRRGVRGGAHSVDPPTSRAGNSRHARGARALHPPKSVREMFAVRVSMGAVARDAEG